MIQMLNLLSAKISMVMETLRDLDREAPGEPQTSDCSSHNVSMRVA